MSKDAKDKIILEYQSDSDAEIRLQRAFELLLSEDTTGHCFINLKEKERKERKYGEGKCAPLYYPRLR